MYEDNGPTQLLQAASIGSEQAFGVPSLILGPPPRPYRSAQPFASAAVDMVKRGLAVIPCGRNDGKKPSIKFWGRRHYSEVTIKKFVGRHPTACMGLLSNLNDLVFVDINSKDRAFANDIERIYRANPAHGAHAKRWLPFILCFQRRA